MRPVETSLYAHCTLTWLRLRTIRPTQSPLFCRWTFGLLPPDVIQEGSLQANVDCLYLLRVRAEDEQHGSRARAYVVYPS